MPEEQEQSSTKARLAAIKMLMIAIYETVEEMGEGGAPEGPMLLAMQEKFRIEVDKYNTFVQALLDVGVLTRRNHCLFIVKAKAQELGLCQ